MSKFGRFTTLFSAAAFLALGSAAAEADIISIIGVPSVFGSGFNLTTTSSRISLSDFFDRYDETRWEITSAIEDSNGGVQVAYNYPVYGTWDSYGARADIQFQILPDDGNLTPEQVTVDIWGSSFYRHQLSRACCFSDAPQVDIFGPLAPSTYTARYDATYDSFDVSHVLLTNTTYSLYYWTSQYVEGTPSGNDLPIYFSTRQQYDSFVAARGTSGTIFASAFGFMNFNLALRPSSVPEPGSLALLGIALAGLLFARRRARN
jgi:hypothetical protein